MSSPKFTLPRSFFLLLIINQRYSFETFNSSPVAIRPNDLATNGKRILSASPGLNLGRYIIHIFTWCLLHVMHANKDDDKDEKRTQTLESSDKYLGNQV